MATNKKPNPAGLIAIANPKLAEKLDKSTEESAKAASKEAKTTAEKSKQAKHVTFNDDKWKAVFALNLLRYGLAIFLIGLLIVKNTDNEYVVLTSVNHEVLFQVSSIILLASAVCFTIFTKFKQYPLSVILITQFITDIFLAGALVHSTGGIESNFVLLFLIVVATGSVVLRRKHAIGLASGATLMLFYEHFYSYVVEEVGAAESSFDTLAAYCILLIIAGFSISYLAQRLRIAEMQSFSPGDESIEDYLVREEKAALKSALDASDGNKTEAAKLLVILYRD